MENTKHIAILWCLILSVGLLSGKISVSPSKIAIDDAKINYVETPFVPIVFFDSGSADVPNNHNDMLTELARRLVDNPDAIVEIRGYYHITGDRASGNAMLAKYRADAVRAKLIQIEPSIASQVIAEPASNPKRLWRGDDGSLDLKIQQENQRAEIAAKVSRQMENKFDSTDPNTILKTLKSNDEIYRIERVLADNPLVFLLIEGTNLSDSDNSAKSLKILDKVRQKLLDNMENDAVKSRVFISVKNDNNTNKSINISVSAEWIVGKPTCENRSTGTVEPQSVRIESDKAGTMKIFRDDGYKIADVSSRWNLSPIPEPTRKYFVSSISANSSPAQRRIWSKKIEFKYSSKPKMMSEKLIIENFNIDQLIISDTPKYCANRDLLAKYLVSIAKVNRNRTISIKIAGYTDDTGDDEKNRQMSLHWANKEFDYFANLIKFYSGKKVENIDKNNAKCGNIEFEIIGMKNVDDNPKISESTPQGRVAKRRVEIKMEIK
ncbi:OmpA family protein [bacterium]|nr:OmpA family protein [bacterium]